MFLANCVQRISKLNFTKCLNKNVCSLRRYYVCTANVSNNPVNSVNSSLPNITSVVMFTNFYQLHNRYWCNRRNYSSNRNDKDDDGDVFDNLENWERKLPRFDGEYTSAPSPYLMLKNCLAVLLIRSYFDPTFNKKEFLEGAKQAIEVVSNLLADGNFDGLQELVDDDTIDKMRQIVGLLTPEQRKYLAINAQDIGWIFPYEIQFITKENTENNQNRFFVEIMVVVHASQESEMDLQNLSNVENAELLDHMEKHYSIANYRFIKEFTKGVEDDWTINHINHVKPSDEIKEQKKLHRKL